MISRLASLAMAAIFVVGCGATASPNPSGSASAPPSGSVASSSPAAPAVPQDLTVAGPVALIDLDPHGPNAMEDPTQQMSRHLYDAVVRRDKGEIVPGLATDWTNTDPLTWTFKIRSDAKFTNGDPVTAADVKASLERIRKLDGPIAPLFGPVDTIEAPNATTLVVKTKTPLGDMLNDLSLTYVLPASLADTKDFFLHPIGSGPFKVRTYTPGQSIVIEKNADYWGGPPTLDSITFQEIPDVSGRVTALTTGEIDATWGLPPDQLSALQSNADVTVEKDPSLAFYYQWFNSKRKPFDDVRVRQALWYALDLQTMTTSLFGDNATVAQAPLTSATFGFAAQPPYTFDQAKAKQLLADAGYPNGFEATIQYSTTCCAQIDQIVQAMISDWAKVGVKVTPNPKEQAQWVDDLLALNWDMNVAINETITGSADFTIGRLYTCTAGPNQIGRMGYCNKDLDATIAKAQQELDRAKQAALWGDAIKTIWSDAVGISLFDVKANFEYRKNVRGFVAPEYSFPFFYGVSLGE
jgi:peptide/nickel transport system substrate-binding protein